ncbi:MAG: serine hydrolase [Clostridia bacterium]|nr:serine hydrolase [Clostridia bacterium]
MKKIVLVIMLLLFLLGCEKQTEHNTLIEKDLLEVKEEVQEYTYNFDEVLERLNQVSNMRNLSISIGDQIILEEYFNACSERSKNNVFSVTKSITSLLVGKAIEEGYIKDVNQYVYEFIDLAPYNVPENYYEITLQDLLTMSSGIEWDNANHTNEFINLKASEDPLTYIFEKPSTFKPGDQFNYSDATAHLMAEVLYKATGQYPLDYANDKLFEPLGITGVTWSSARDGVQIGGCDLHLSLKDMQKIGQLILNHGAYEDEQIIESEWIDQITTKQIATGNGSGYDVHYGYYYWLGHISRVDTISSLGHGGQFIVVIPEYEVVITASTIGGVSDQMAYRQFSDVADVIYLEIIPLLLEKM